MSFLRGFCNQNASLEAYTGKDGFGRATFAPPRSVRVRKQPAKGVRRSATGMDVSVETYYMTEAVVTVQDKLDGSPVRRVQEIINKAGKRLGCEVWV